MRSAFTTLTALALALVVVATACTHDARKPTTVQLADPGHCTAVDVAAAPETAALLRSLADDFNESPSAKLNGQGCAFVRVQSIDSATAARGLIAGWTDTTTLGPEPEIWVPASSAWIAQANEQLAAKKSPAIATSSSSYARTSTVIALPAPLARALGWPKTPIGWSTLARLAGDARGWGAVGHPEWGPFKLGKANPNASTNALLATLALRRDPGTARALESSVVYYGDADWPFLDTWNRLAKKTPPSHFVSAVITDERSVTAYDRGSPNGVVPTTVKTTKRLVPLVPLVAIKPADGASESDNPLALVRRRWVSAEARAGATAFIAFAHTASAQQAVKAAGLAAGRVGATSFTPMGSVDGALTDWSKIRKRARVLLVFDESDSMGDPSDPRDPSSAPKITLAKRALLSALSQFAADDEVGLRIFTTHVRNSPSPNWADVVPMGRFSTRKRALVGAIKNLTPKQGSPLYSATRGAYDTVRANYDPKRINAVVLLTDGYNEDDKNNNLTALLAHLREPTRMFTISYSGDADLPTLRKIAQATNARVYDASLTTSIGAIYRAALENF